MALLPRPFGERGAREETSVLRDAPTPALPQRGREQFGEAVFCSLAPLGRGLGRGARVRKRLSCAMPPPRPSPRGGGSKSGRTSFSLAPLGRGLGRGARVRQRLCCAMPHPGPPPEGEGANRGSPADTLRRLVFAGASLLAMGVVHKGWGEQICGVCVPELQLARKGRRLIFIAICYILARSP
jgi:hypothetical protein